MELSISGLRKRFGAVEALAGVDLSVEAGEFFAVLGPSAAGKTTLLRSIAGLERPDSGRIVFGGQDMADRPVRGREMAMIFQTFALYPHLSVRGNLAYPLREAGVEPGEVRRRVGEIAEMLRIAHTLDRKPATLSGGEQQRVAIGRALIRRPKLLLLDEPLTNLDAKLRHDTRAEFKRLHRELGMTMLYATPDQLEALTMGERIAALRAGRIVQIGTPRDLYAAPANEFVATLVGAPSMNILPATLHHGGDGPVVRLSFVELPVPDPRLIDIPAGTELLVGIRPHDLAPVRQSPRGPTFSGQVRLTEPLGDVSVIDIGAGDTVLKIVLGEESALSYGVGSDIAVDIPVADAHLFFRETGVAIC
jgi:multiple sugar transport system ATP-binding protein